MRGNVIPNVNRLFAVPSPKLCNVCHSRIVEGPKSIFIEGFDALLYSDLYGIGKQIILAKQILLLNPSV